MIFTSSIFWIFLFIVLLVYFIIPKNSQWIVLLIASYVFYLFSGYGMVTFLLFTTTISFFAGILLEKINNNSKDYLNNNKSLTREQRKEFKHIIERKKRIIIFISIMLIFSILGFLKYYNFFSLNLTTLSNKLSINLDLPSLQILLPLGISFYTFQSVGYIIDINRGKIKADKNFPKFALFLSYFPQIVQGPISRYDQLAKQLYESHPFNYDRVKFGFQLVLWGLFKKMVIADRLAIPVNNIFNNYLEYEGFSIFVGVLFFSFQMYCDFSGGIDIARGISEVMGINLVENFQRPFFSSSIDEYWRRWHITLGSWMREYVFYPLSLSKAFTKLGRSLRKTFGNYLGKILPTLIATIITFLAVGIWHGPNWKYVAFGLYYGILISAGIFLAPVRKSTLNKLKIKTDGFSWRLLNILFVFFATTIGRYFARADGIMQAGSMLKRTFSVYNPWVFFDGSLLKLGLSRHEYSIVFISILVLLLIEIFQENGVHIRTTIAKQNLLFRWSLYLAAIFTVLIFGIYGPEYVATDFIYQGF